MDELPRIAAEAWVDPSRRIHRCGETAYVPVREGCAWDMELPERTSYRGRGFQRLGDVIVLHGRPPDAGEIAAIVAWERPRGILHLRSLQGATRTPDAVLLYGTCGEVCHHENGCRYWLDPERVMFAQGNREERARMGAVVRESGRCERIADMCAGIGYFTVPMARGGGQVHAIELNPAAFRYLERNVAENGVQDRVQCSCGDCRVLLEGRYDRLVLGHFESGAFLPAALRHAQAGSVLHVHSVGSMEAEIRALAAERGFSADVIVRRVKKYGPRALHVVQDVRLA